MTTILSNEEREAKFGGPPPPRTLEQRWVLATQGILTELNGTSHIRVGGEPRPYASGVSAFRLRQHWNVRNAREARRCLTWLFDEGHRFAYARETDRAPDDYLGWDLVRASAVAGWSFVAYHIEIDEAWAAMLRAARALRRQFGSWTEVGASYGLGRDRWGKEGREIEELTARLVAPGGGWDLPWAVDIAGDIPAPVRESIPELVVDGSGAGGAFKTIAEALLSEKAPKRVIVRAGVYDETVRIKSPIELIADGEVVIRNGRGAPLLVDHTAYIRGFRLEASHNEKNETMQAVWVGDNFMKLVDCVMRTERCGVYAGKDRTEAHVEGCTIIEPGVHGILAENGAHMSILDTTVERPTGCGVVADGSGELHVENAKIRDAGGPSLSLRGARRGEIRGVEITGARSNGVEVLGAATADFSEIRVTGSKGTGALFGSSAEGVTTIEQSEITGNAGNDVGVIAGSVYGKSLVLGGGPACAIAVQAGDLDLESSTIQPTEQPSVWLMGQARTSFVECKLANEREIVVFANPWSVVSIDRMRRARWRETSRRRARCERSGPRRRSYRGKGRLPSRRSGRRCRGPGRDLRCTDRRPADAPPAICVEENADVSFVECSVESIGGDAALVAKQARVTR